jgi:hypothetical protein
MENFVTFKEYILHQEHSNSKKIPYINFYKDYGVWQIRVIHSYEPNMTKLMITSDKEINLDFTEGLLKTNTAFLQNERHILEWVQAHIFDKMEYVTKYQKDFCNGSYFTFNSCGNSYFGVFTEGFLRLENDNFKNVNSLYKDKSLKDKINDFWANIYTPNTSNIPFDTILRLIETEETANIELAVNIAKWHHAKEFERYFGFSVEYHENNRQPLGHIVKTQSCTKNIMIKKTVIFHKNLEV